MCCLHLPVDCQEIKFLEREMTSLEQVQKKIHCSVKDDDFHESQLQIDHKSLLGCHRDNENECVVEEGWYRHPVEASSR